jgi:hypothetical protein
VTSVIHRQYHSTPFLVIFLGDDDIFPFFPCSPEYHKLLKMINNYQRCIAENRYLRQSPYLSFQQKKASRKCTFIRRAQLTLACCRDAMIICTFPCIFVLPAQLWGGPRRSHQQPEDRQ